MIDEIDNIIPAVFHFNFTDFKEDFTPRLLVEHNWWTPLMELVGNMVFNFTMYNVHYFKADIFGNSLLFTFSDECNNKQVNFYY